MNKLIAAGVIAILAVSAIVLTVHSYLQTYKANQLNLKPDSSPTPTPNETPTETAAIPKPSIPEFTVELVDNSYDVPEKTTTKIDQYTGKETETTTPSYHVENKSIEITIKNQPLSPYTNANASSYEGRLYYNVRVKGHFGEEWTAPISFKRHDPVSRIPVSSSSGYTVVTCSADYPPDAYLDFQVEAFIGHNYWDSIPDHPLGVFSAFKVDATSGWSTTHDKNSLRDS
jgi:hypothetical protein